MKRSLLALSLVSFSVVAETVVCPAPTFFKPLNIVQTEVYHAMFPTKESQQTRLILVNFWASWCGSCRQELPLLEQLAAEGYQVELINIGDSPKVANELLLALGITDLTTKNKTVSLLQQLGLSGIPATVVQYKNSLFLGMGRLKAIEPIKIWLNCLSRH